MKRHPPAESEQGDDGEDAAAPKLIQTAPRMDSEAGPGHEDQPAQQFRHYSDTISQWTLLTVSHATECSAGADRTNIP